MSLKHIDKEDLKTVLAEFLEENPEYFKSIMKEILAEKQSIMDKKQVERTKKVEKLISEDFDRYDEVFKLLA